MESASSAKSSSAPAKGQEEVTPKDSQTASEFINSQLQLENEAREALPYAFDQCTQALGSLRQNLYSCLTCRPPPSSPSEPYKPAGVCYSCSIACHGEHELVELFARRDFTCDCGTTRLPATSPCTLRINPATGMKGPVDSQLAAPSNTYNQNFRNRFCGCGDVYDAHQQKGTMYQCVGLATEQDGGCGEDWWHPECLLGLPHDWYKTARSDKTDGVNGTKQERLEDQAQQQAEGAEEQEHPVPSGFPSEDQIETLICYKCCEVAPWIKQYAGTDGFLPPIYLRQSDTMEIPATNTTVASNQDASSTTSTSAECQISKKRKVDDMSDAESTSPKRIKPEELTPIDSQTDGQKLCKQKALPPAPQGLFSIIASNEDFRTRFCRCADCYPLIKPYPQLLEEEDNYEPPLSEEGENEGGGSVGTGSLLERGEAALSNVDRVRAIEGVMVYNHLKDKVKTFLQPFAERGEAVSAEAIKEYFEKLRGDAEAIREAGGVAMSNGGGRSSNGDGDGRQKQSGY
ncbi:hypothetical protein MMC25_000356 [Agyrium rufum]|nr:hypothetical protein [Agyrium rufum]